MAPQTTTTTLANDNENKASKPKASAGESMHAQRHGKAERRTRKEETQTELLGWVVEAEDYPRLGARCPSGQECHKANEKWEESKSRAGAVRNSDQRAAKLRTLKDGEQARY